MLPAGQELTRRPWLALHFSSQPSPSRPGMVKMAPRFLLQNSPTSAGCRAECGTVFGSWHSWRPSAHTLACRLPEGSQPSRSSQAGPIVCLALCPAKVFLSNPDQPCRVQENNSDHPTQLRALYNPLGGSKIAEIPNGICL